ncbi:MAG TPA: response regulator [Blastocatellia bacterium]
MPDKILVVDDSDDTREMMAKLLEMESYSVVTAGDGQIGLEVAEAELPDLIITDIHMPNLNGIEMIRILREHPMLQSIPIMAITAYGSAVASEALQMGADYATSKPVEFETLIGGIKTLLSRNNSSFKEG